MSEQPRRVAIGKLGRPHGIRGEIRLFPFNPASRTVTDGLDVYIRRDEQLVRKARIEQARYANRFVILKLAGIDDRDEADRLKHAILNVDYDDLPDLADDEFYYVDLVDAPVYVADEENQDIDEHNADPIGTVGRFFATGANDVMVVECHDRDDLFVPLVDHAVFVLDFERHLVVLQPLHIWAPADD